MEVILREDVPGLGIIGEVVRVKPGYARNYLLPRGLAVEADRRNLGELEHHKRIIAAKKKRERGAHESLATRLGGMALEVEARAGKGGKLFGSVTNMDVSRLLDEKGFTIDRRLITLRDPIKEIGDYDVTVRVGQDVTATVKVTVKPLGGELEAADEEEKEEARAAQADAAETEEAAGDDVSTADGADDDGADDDTPPA